MWMWDCTAVVYMQKSAHFLFISKRLLFAYCTVNFCKEDHIKWTITIVVEGLSKLGRQRPPGRKIYLFIFSQSFAIIGFALINNPLHA